MSAVLRAIVPVTLGLACLVACGASESRPSLGSAENDAGTSAPVAPPAKTACEGIRCNVPHCEGGATTAIEGDVYDPAGKTKLYNVLAYVPNAELAPFEAGATCDRCGTVSGDPIAAGISDEAGHFRIEGVPAGDEVPVVLQVGKWRRTIVVPHVEACTTTTLADKTARLPGRRADGDMPKIAAVSGGFDELACLLARIGVAADEYALPTDEGSVHLYRGVGGGDYTLGGAPKAETLWSEEATLSKYDMVLLACEGWENDDPEDAQRNKTPEAKSAMHAYLAKGGRVFATHYHYAWFKESPEEDFRGVATWNEPATAYGHETLTVDTSFPKGVAFSKWLVNVGASTTADALEVDNPAANVATVNDGVAQRWLYGERGVSYMSFNTPIGAAEDAQCGRAVISDVHVSGEQGSKPTPGECNTAELTPQEKALEFLLFDLVGCIQPDGATPKPPIVK